MNYGVSCFRFDSNTNGHLEIKEDIHTMFHKRGYIYIKYLITSQDNHLYINLVELIISC